MPLSRDPAKRRRQLENLSRTPNAGSFKPGQPSPNLKHGLRTRPPARPAEWKRHILGPALDEIVEALAEGAPLRDKHGDVPIHDRLAIEATAVLLLTVRRCASYLDTHGDVDSRGNLRPEVAELGKASERLLKALDRLGMTPAGRAKLGVDVLRAERERQDLALLMARHTEAQDRPRSDDDAIEGDAADA